MLMGAFQDSDTCFPIRYRFDGNIINLRRLQTKTMVQTDVLDELLYADDMDKRLKICISFGYNPQISFVIFHNLNLVIFSGILGS